ncbi:MAG: metallophosphoesterase, partial [Candidatus Aureabacteria bacterium]|nr:metallophosphoesterase [Candidatus Auribacterota bacterium]
DLGAVPASYYFVYYPDAVEMWYENFKLGELTWVLADGVNLKIDTINLINEVIDMSIFQDNYEEVVRGLILRAYKYNLESMVVGTSKIIFPSFMVEGDLITEAYNSLGPVPGEGYLSPLSESVSHLGCKEAEIMKPGMENATIAIPIVELPLTEYHTYAYGPETKTAGITWIDSELLTKVGSLRLTGIRSEIKQGIFDQGLFHEWMTEQGISIEQEAFAVTLEYMESGQYKRMYKLTFSDQEAAVGNRGEAPNDMEFQINHIMIPVIAYWADPPVPNVMEDGYRIVDGREIFIREWVEGRDGLEYVKDLRELGVSEQEIADLIFRKMACSSYKIWKATGYVIVGDVTLDNVLFNAAGNAIFFDFDIVDENSAFDALFLSHLEDLKNAISLTGFTMPDLPTPNDAYAIVGYHDAMMEEIPMGMTVEQVWNELSKLAAIDMEAYNKAVEIIEGAVTTGYVPYVIMPAEGGTFFIPDVHGGYGELVSLLINGGIIEIGGNLGDPGVFSVKGEVFTYTGGNTLLVFLGDLIDKGSYADKVILLAGALELQTDVIALLGNHEADLFQARYVYDQNPSYFGLESTAITLKQFGYTDAQIVTFMAAFFKDTSPDTPLSELLEEGPVEVMYAENPEATEYIKWLQKNPVIAKIILANGERCLVMHAGFTRSALDAIKTSPGTDIWSKFSNAVLTSPGVFYSVVVAWPEAWINDAALLEEILTLFEVDKIMVG